MADTIEIIIDDKKLKAVAGQTVLEVCRANGIEIPTLCHHESVEGYGSCRICVVELVRDGWSQLVTSCIYPVRRPIVVRTDSDKVRRARKLVLELLLARCPDADVIRKMATEYGIDESRFPVRGETSCILCGNCVRVCREVVGADAIGFANRGAARDVVTPFREHTEACIGCGACAAVCPTGAISMHDTDGVRRFEYINVECTLSRCVECGEQFAPTKQIEHVRTQIDYELTAFDYCPRCRKKLAGGKLKQFGYGR